MRNLCVNTIKCIRKGLLAISITFMVFLILPEGDLFALTMEEAVETALNNNHQARQYGYLQNSAEQAVGSARSSFLPSVDLGYSYSEANEDVFSSGKRYTSFSAEASLNLFNGMSDMYGLLGARENARASMYEKKAVLADVALGVKEAYIDLLRAMRSHEVATESVELLGRQRREAELYYREGLIARNDLLRVEVELSTARQDLLEAEGNLRLGRKALERAMGVRLEEEVAIEDFKDIPELEALTPEALKEEMLSRRSEIRYLRAIKEYYSYSADSVKGGYMPSVDLSVSYNKYGETASVGGDDEDTGDYTKAMVSATWNIFGGGSTTYGLREARYLVRAAEEQLRDTEAELVLQLEDALEGYRVSRGKLDVARTGVKQAEENYRVTENRHREREATSVDLLDASFFLTRARNQYFDALYDVHASVAGIERVLERDISVETETSESPTEEASGEKDSSE